jgi:hypothetical protein
MLGTGKSYPGGTEGNHVHLKMANRRNQFYSYETGFTPTVANPRHAEESRDGMGGGLRRGTFAC